MEILKRIFGILLILTIPVGMPVTLVISLFIYIVKGTSIFVTTDKYTNYISAILKGEK
jgi:hypothetical protein